MSLLTSCVVLVALQGLTVTSGIKRIRCISGQYYDNITGECARCSPCPMNQIIRHPCNADRDTICGPFYEFQDFNQGSADIVNRKLTLSTVDAAADAAEGWDAEHEMQDAVVRDTDEDYPGPSEAPGPLVQKNDRHWKVLCFGLTGALAIITLLAILYIVVTQMQVRRARKGKTILIADPEDPAVYYKTGMIPPACDPPAGYQNHHYLQHLGPDMERQHLCAIADNACVGHQGNYIDHQGNLPLRIITNRLDNDLAEGYIVVPGVHHASLDSGLCSSTPNVAHL